MRILIVTSPGIGHIFPIIPTAWALRAAGHDILVATSANQDQVANAGLPVVDTAPGVNFAEVFTSVMPDGWRAGPGDTGIEFATKLFAVISGKFVDHTVRLANTWQPDLVMYTPLQGAGPLAAAVLGVPSVVHEISPASGALLVEPLAERMTDQYDRFGVRFTPAAGLLEVLPPSLRDPAEPPVPCHTMRYVPYNGGAVLPDWVLEPRDRERVVVTLGTVTPRMGGMAALRPIIAAAGKLDAEFVLALGGADLSELGALPDNLRPVGWVPLGALLRNSDAVIHHGGAGTTLTALDAGLPQFILPQGADQFRNGQVVAASGAGAVLSGEELDAARLTDLLTDAAFAASARRVAADIAAQPTSAELVPTIVGMAG